MLLLWGGTVGVRFLQGEDGHTEAGEQKAPQERRWESGVVWREEVTGRGGCQDWAEEEKAFQEGGHSEVKGSGVEVGRAESGGSVE